MDLGVILPPERIAAMEARGDWAGKTTLDYLDAAVAEGSIPPQDTRVATLAWLGAVNEVVIQWLYSGRPDLMAEAVPALTPLLLRSIGAAQ